MEQYNQQIHPDATQATVPEEIHPVAAAFGGDIGQALEQGGQQVASRIENLSTHLARMNYYKQEAQKADILTNYKTAWQNKAFGDPNDPHATVTAVNGSVVPKDLTFSPGESPSDTQPSQTMEVPAGIYQRKGYAAAGSLEDADNWHHQTSEKFIQDAQAQGLGGRALTQLKTSMDNAWASERNLIAKNESTEVDNAQQKSFLTGMQLDADQAVTKQDPISLARTIDSIKQNNDSLNQWKDPQDPIRQITENEYIGKALNNSMTANLKSNGGNPEQFQSILDKLHTDGKIDDTVYENAQEHMDKVSTSIMRQNERVVKVDTLNTNMNFLKMTMDKKIDFTNPNILSDISMRSPMAGEAISNYQEHKDSFVPDKESAFGEATKQVAAHKSAEEFQTYAFNEMKKYPQGISQERFDILVGYGMKRAENLKQLREETDRPVNGFLNLIDGGMSSLIQKKADAQSLIDYQKAILDKKSPHDAVNIANTNYAVRLNPSVAAMASPPNLVINKDSNIKAVFPRTNRKDNGNSDSGSTDK